MDLLLDDGTCAAHAYGVERARFVDTITRIRKVYDFPRADHITLKGTHAIFNGFRGRWWLEVHDPCLVVVKKSRLSKKPSKKKRKSRTINIPLQGPLTVYAEERVFNPFHLVDVDAFEADVNAEADGFITSLAAHGSACVAKLKPWPRRPCARVRKAKKMVLRLSQGVGERERERLTRRVTVFRQHPLQPEEDTHDDERVSGRGA